MGLTVVHEEIVVRSYKAPAGSGAHLYKIISNLLCLLLPLVICLSTQGFWKKTNTYLEQPKIEFNGQTMFVLTSNNPNSYFLWSSYQELNIFNVEKLVMPAMEYRGIDRNNDGINDEILVDVTLNIPESNFRVYGVFYMLEFNVKLDYRAVIEMNPMILSQDEHLTSRSALYVSGDLNLVQKRPLPSSGEYNFDQNLTENSTNPYNLTREDVSGIPYEDMAEYFPAELLIQNLRRNYALDLLGKTEFWSPLLVSSSDNISNNTFTFHFHFFIRQQVLTYRTGFWELLKWAWIQYLAIYVIIKVIFNGLSSFLYENRILGTIIYEKIKTKITYV